MDNSVGQRSSPYRTVIGHAQSASRMRLGELYAFRDLFRFLVWREIKVRYAQSALGISWAIIQPLVSAIIMMIVFGYVAGMSTDGASKFLFYFCPLVPWTCFANALTDGTASLVSNASMLSKVYFPRVLLPLAATTARLLDFFVALVLLAALLVIEGVSLNVSLLVLPLLTVLMLVAAAGLGLWLTALAIQYRDVKYAITFVVQLLMYLSPVIYSASRIPDSLTVLGVTFNPRLIYGLNPMAGVADGFRAAVLGTFAIPWDLIAVGSVSAVVILFTGLLYFRGKERIFADVA
ncbi:ABC transporter permease [Roseimaritima ulvae]|uniref:Transport permease protein n=1 Tax=Roseimaritima ulvae TaxID=980254 RepID=A0A5B9QVI5_9BACT|nr:ABC transporter permease [Roseimaritima ulvae]QEG43054.1 Teichoic acid translocation permease protein TagG [Roseimaritima ulvae]